MCMIKTHCESFCQVKLFFFLVWGIHQMDSKLALCVLGKCKFCLCLEILESPCHLLLNVDVGTCTPGNLRTDTSSLLSEWTSANITETSADVIVYSWWKLSLCRYIGMNWTIMTNDNSQTSSVLMPISFVFLAVAKVHHACVSCPTILYNSCNSWVAWCWGGSGCDLSSPLFPSPVVFLPKADIYVFLDTDL